MLHPAAIWSDTAVFQARHEKSAGALIAVQGALRGGGLAAEKTSEFFRLYRFCFELPNWVFTRVWCDPRAYFWARTAYDLVGKLRQGGDLSPQARTYLAALAGESSAAWLPRHLDEFAPFALAGATLAGRELHLRRPYRVRLPFALPGTGTQLVGNAAVRLHGYRGGALLLSDRDGVRYALRLHSGAQAAGIRVVEDPLLDCGANRVRLSVAPFNLPGFGFATEVLDADAAYHRRWLPLIRRAFDKVQRHHPESHAQMSESLRVVALKPLDCGSFTNMTHSDLPGAFILSVVDDPWELADTIIHEFHHNRLFFLEEGGAFFADAAQNTASDASYYSPWRDDPRPLDGILHAVYVHLPVCDYWTRVLRDARLERATRAYALDRLSRFPAQIGMGLDQLRRHARFTRRGRELMRELERRFATLQRRLAGLPRPADVRAFQCNAQGELVEERDPATGAPMSVLDVLRQHRRRCDVHGQCRRAGFDQPPAA